jgi:hypothetical protein
MDRTRLVDILRRNLEVTVAFVKGDGTNRIMKCTLHPDVIPEVFGKSVEGPEHLVTVFDLEKQAWRSINLTTHWEIHGQFI